MRKAKRVTIDEVMERMDRGELFLFVDARSDEAWEEAEARIPGAIRVSPDDVEVHLSDITHGRAVIIYCTCPNEASSARVAQELTDSGCQNIHPLFMGFEAWQKEGLPLEPK